MDLSFLARVFEATPPFATVYLDTTRTTEQASRSIGTAWRELRRELADQGAPERLLAALDDRAGADAGVSGPHGQVLVAADDGVRLEHTLPSPPRRQMARLGTLPHLMPFVAQLSETAPYVLVVVDRTGADVTAYGPFGEKRAEQHVKGGTLHVRKVKPGDWAHKQFQRRSENLWNRNAAEVGAEVDALVDTVAPCVLAVAGDTRARRALIEHLSGRSRELVAEVESGGRAAGTADEKMHADVERLVAEHAARSVADVVGQFDQERGRHGAAVEGLGDVVDALRRAQVRVLLLRDDPSATTALWSGPEPLQLGTSRGDVSGLGVAEPVEVRADSAFVRALAASDAELVVSPQLSDTTDGVGALLRYTDPSTPA
jgi:hypothetical protein